MTTDPRAAPPIRRLFVGWQDPDHRSFVPVAALVRIHAEPIGFYRFAYLRAAQAERSFEPFASFPEFTEVYESDTLFPFFANRVMSRKRADFPQMMELLDLSVEAEPFEILARSGGRRATDRLEVFPEPEVDAVGTRGHCLFFVRGIRYVPGAEGAISRLDLQSQLRPLLDVQNPKNPAAVMLIDQESQLVGYLPDYLTQHFHTVLTRCGAQDLEIKVEHVNPHDSPRNLRLMCRLTSCWPPDYRPSDADQFQPVVAGALDELTVGRFSRART